MRGAGRRGLWPAPVARPISGRSAFLLFSQPLLVASLPSTPSEFPFAPPPAPAVARMSGSNSRTDETTTQPESQTQTGAASNKGAEARELEAFRRTVPALSSLPEDERIENFGQDFPRDSGRDSGRGGFGEGRRAAFPPRAIPHNPAAARVHGTGRQSRGASGQLAFALDAQKLGPSEKEREVLEWSEIAKHNTPEDCWMVLNGTVYDITDYAKVHPGGSSILHKFAGQDATAKFNAVHRWVSHRSLLQHKIVGVVNQPQPPEEGKPRQTHLLPPS